MPLVNEDYLLRNQAAYDTLAPYYRERIESDRERDLQIVDPFVSYIRAHFGDSARVLDIGPGHGVNLAMFDKAGFSVTGIDLSPRMLEVARETCPQAELLLGDFLTTSILPQLFHGVFAKASLHLLPKRDAQRAFCKVFDLLVDFGLFYFATTASELSKEGMFEKHDYPVAVTRFRKCWQREELLESLCAAGFSVFRESYNSEPARGKNWYNLWVIRPKRP